MVSFSGVIDVRRLIRDSSFRVLLVIGAAFFMLPVHATQLVEVNIAKIPVSDQSQRTQNSALKSALNEVMVKLSGNKSVLENAGVKAALRTPQAYLRSYRFEYKNGQTLYVAEFDKTKLTDLLKRERLALWGERRPETLVWLATETSEGERLIMDEGHHTAASQRLADTANERGVPLLFPLMDLTDNENISIYDVWGRFVNTLTRASERYAVDNIIGARIYKNTSQSVPDMAMEPTEVDSPDMSVSEVINKEMSDFDDGGLKENTSNAARDDELSQSGLTQRPRSTQPFSVSEFTQHLQKAQAGDYALDWVFIGGGSVTYGSIYSDKPEDLTAELVDAYANYLASQYAVVPGENTADRIQLEISVANVNSLSKYAHASNYLNSLSVVENAMLIAQEGSVATYKLTLLGNPDDLLNTIRLESKLQPVTDAFGQVVEGYNFYWNE